MKKQYILEAPYPLAFDNPILNISIAGKPYIVSLTESEVEFVRRVVPNVKIVLDMSSVAAPVVEPLVSSEEPESQVEKILTSLDYKQPEALKYISEHTKEELVGWLSPEDKRGLVISTYNTKMS